MNRFFPVKHLISFGDKNYSDYFNKVPFILSIENVKNHILIIILKKLFLVTSLDIEFEAKKYGEIFVEVGNVYCDYFRDFGKETENMKINFEKGKLIEYNLNGECVEDIIMKNKCLNHF